MAGVGELRRVLKNTTADSQGMLAGHGWSGPALTPNAGHTLPPQVVPGSKARVAGDRLAGSYANFYLCNGGVVVPAFGGEAAEADER
jgi:agmatine/peptidylarginine deiminase